MKKFIVTAAVAVLMVGVAVAGPGSKGNSNGGNRSSPSSNNFKSTSNYHLSFGKSFSHGFFYEGRNHNHWSFNCYWPKYGCQCYWCPSTLCYYYWCATACCYYPISYITISPPTPSPVTGPVTVIVPAGYPELPK